MHIFDNDNFSIIPKSIFFDNDNLPIRFKYADISTVENFFDNIAHPHLCHYNPEASFYEDAEIKCQWPSDEVTFELSRTANEVSDVFIISATSESIWQNLNFV